jgi:hypothetical protein
VDLSKDIGDMIMDLFKGGDNMQNNTPIKEGRVSLTRSCVLGLLDRLDASTLEPEHQIEWLRYAYIQLSRYATENAAEQLRSMLNRIIEAET